jgi:hypothetical protein
MYDDRAMILVRIRVEVLRNLHTHTREHFR